MRLTAASHLGQFISFQALGYKVARIVVSEHALGEYLCVRHSLLDNTLSCGGHFSFHIPYFSFGFLAKTRP